MRINRVEAYKLLSFKSTRTDRNTVEQLKKGEKPIIENNRQNILSALNNLSSQPNRTNIEFLLDVADNLAYGQGGEDSAFQSTLDEDGFTPSERENSDWNKALKDTISLALSTSKDNVSDLQVEFDRIFAPKKELTEEQKEILGLRKSLTERILGEDTLEDVETLTRTTNIFKNLDYFVASSEIPTKQKKDVLGKLIYFMSDDYKINPQLQDKKTQVIDEMLGDMVIKTPESAILSIKPVNQRQSGICAAISICRKHMAYEDKSRYTEIIMDELNNSPTMSVYDVTELGTGKKVEIHKPQIDFNAALEHGYRIIDTSAHIWMQNAHASGNGTIQTENYVAFDEANYGIFNDSSFYLAFDERLLKEHTLLAAVIKEREFYDSFMTTKKKYTEAARTMNSVKKEVLATQSATLGNLNTILKAIFPERTNAELTNTIRSSIKLYNGTDKNNEVNIAQQLPKEVKQDILTEFIIESLGENVSEEQKAKLKEQAPTMLNMVVDYTSAEDKLKQLKSLNSPRSKFIYNKKLYKLAAAHRVAMEANVNLDNGVITFEKVAGVKPRELQILSHLKDLKAESNSQTIRQLFPSKDGTILTQEQFEDALMKDSAKIEKLIPSGIDSVLEALSGFNTAQSAAKLFESTLNAIVDGNKSALEYAKNNMDIKGKKPEIIKKLNRIIDELNNNPSQKAIGDAIRTLGYENRIDFAAVLITSISNSLSNGVSEEQLQRYEEQFGSKENIVTGINAEIEKFQKLATEYAEIENRWKVPTARANILEGLEKQKGVLSRKKLNKLQQKFAEIEAQTIQNEKIPNVKERSKANSKLYNFSQEEEDIFQEIEKNLATMKKYSKMQYLALNKNLFDALEQQYSYIGRLNGQFWVREEGSSGLYSNEQIRIIEQMTGKPYHQERDINDAVEQIKKGDGSGILSMSVLHDDYGFHAQYVPAVTSEVFNDSTTGKETTQDVMWTDNSWGQTEKDSFWNGRNGHLYTDYGNGYGWEKGFILGKDFKIGLPVKDMHGAMGIVSKDDNEEFSLVSGVVLPGLATNAYTKLYETFARIMQTGSTIDLYNGLESAITSGYKINPDYLTGLDDVIEAATEKLSKQAEKIKSKEDYEKLQKDDSLRFIFDRLALYFSVDNPEIAKTVEDIKTPADLETAEQNIIDGLVEDMGVVMGKTDGVIEKLFTASLYDISDLFEELDNKFGVSLPIEVQSDMVNSFFLDEEKAEEVDGSLKELEEYLSNNVVQTCIKAFDGKNDEAEKWLIDKVQGIIFANIDSLIRIKSFDSPILASSAGKNLIAAVDKYLNPTSDEDLLGILQTLQNSSFEVASNFIDVLTPEDLGMKKKSGYEYLLKYNTGDSEVYKEFSEMIAGDQLKSLMRTSDNNNETTPEEAYRGLYIALSEMDVQKYIKGFKNEFFEKYKVRQAFPHPIIIPDEQIAASFAEMLTMIKFSIEDLIESKYAYDIILKANEVKEKFASKDLYQQLMKKKDIQITDENREEVEKFTLAMIELCEATSKDKSMPDITEKISNFINEITASPSTINGRKAGVLLKHIDLYFDDLEKAGVTEDFYVAAKERELTKIRENVKQIVNGNIEPKYRDEAISLINKFITAYRKDAPNDELIDIENDAINFLTDKHITKNPTLILKECVRLLSEGKKDTPEYQVMHKYLGDALRTAEQTKIQYKLVKNQNATIGSKTKNLLDLFYVNDPNDNNKKSTLNSDIGLVFLVNTLINANDNNATLRLFLDQTGLSERTLMALINTADMDNAEKESNKVIEASIDFLNISDKICSTMDKYFERNIIPYRSFKDGINHVKKYAERKLSQYEEHPLYKIYLNYLNQVAEVSAYEGLSSERLKEIVRNVNMDGLQQVIDTTTEQILELDKITSQFQFEISLLDIIEVPENSEAYVKRAHIYAKYERLLNHLADKKQQVVDFINNSHSFRKVQD